MSKKQLILVSMVAAIPGGTLLTFLVLGLLQGMLSDTATVSPTLWVVWVVAALGSATIAFLPFAIMFFPGLMPEPVPVGIASDGTDAASAPSGRSPQSQGDESAEDFDESQAADDAGEQLFEDDAMADDYDDEFGDSFDEDPK